MAKLNLAQVDQIKQYANDGIQQKEIARILGLSKDQVNRVLRGHSYTDLSKIPTTTIMKHYTPVPLQESPPIASNLPSQVTLTHQAASPNLPAPAAPPEPTMAEIFLIVESGEPFPVDFAILWPWLGYSTKANAKRAFDSLDLISGSDFASSKMMSATANAENIHLTVDAAKHLCLAARTPQGRKVRTYFIEAESELRKKHFIAAVTTPIIAPTEPTLNQVMDRLASISVNLSDRTLALENRVEHAVTNLPRETANILRADMLEKSKLRGFFQTKLRDAVVSAYKNLPDDHPDKGTWPKGPYSGFWTQSHNAVQKGAISEYSVNDLKVEIGRVQALIRHWHGIVPLFETQHRPSSLNLIHCVIRKCECSFDPHLFTPPGEKFIPDMAPPGWTHAMNIDGKSVLFYCAIHPGSQRHVN